MTVQRTCIRYRIDAQDHIVSVSDNWDAFARDNGGDTILASSILGDSIYEHIEGKTSQYITEQLIHFARTDRGPIIIPFRCDSPDRRRFMRMHISAVEDGLVEFNSCILREEVREPVTVLNAEQEHSDEILNVCSWCKKIQIGATEWVEVEDAVRILHLLEKENPPELSHGMCKNCYDSVIAEIDG